MLGVHFVQPPCLGDLFVARTFGFDMDGRDNRLCANIFQEVLR
jgi:hypothetical protein